MIELIKNILSVAKTLLGMSDQLRAAKQERREKMADLFEKISSCLATVSGEIRVGGIPHGACGELITYSEALPNLIASEVGEKKANDLGKTLRSAYNVERLAMELKNISKKEPHLRKLEEASGKFKALANLTRVNNIDS